MSAAVDSSSTCSQPACAAAMRAQRRGSRGLLEVKCVYASTRGRRGALCRQARTMDESRPPERRSKALSWHEASVDVHESNVLRSALAATDGSSSGSCVRAKSTGFQRNRRLTIAGCRRGANSAHSPRRICVTSLSASHCCVMSPPYDLRSMKRRLTVKRSEPSSMQSAIAEKTMVMPRNVVLKHGKLPHGSFNTHVWPVSGSAMNAT